MTLKITTVPPKYVWVGGTGTTRDVCREKRVRDAAQCQVSEESAAAVFIYIVIDLRREVRDPEPDESTRSHCG